MRGQASDLIDEILDVAKQKGTGMWTSQSAMELQVPIPTIDMAVAMRDMSVFTRRTRTGRFHCISDPRRLTTERKIFLIN